MKIKFLLDSGKHKKIQPIVILFNDDKIDFIETFPKENDIMMESNTLNYSKKGTWCIFGIPNSLDVFFENLKNNFKYIWVEFLYENYGKLNFSNLKENKDREYMIKFVEEK